MPEGEGYPENTTLVTPPYMRDPKPDEISSVWSRMRKRWEGGTKSQRNMDAQQLAFILLMNDLTVADVSNAQAMATAGIDGMTAVTQEQVVKPTAFRSGLGGHVWREDTALISGTPGIRFNYPRNKPDLKNHANRILEPWFQGAMKLSQQAERVWIRQPADLRAVGRAWSHIAAYPRIWANSQEFKDLVKSLSDVADSEEETKKVRREIVKFKADRFPIRWRWTDPRRTWTYFSGENALPEVISVESVTREEATDHWGEKNIPHDLAEKGPGSKVDILHYANHCYDVVSIHSMEDPRIVDHYEHGLEDNPFTLIEAELLPPNDFNWRWAGQLFFAQDTITMFDQVLSDLAHNHKQWTLAPLIIKVREDAYEESEKVQGRPPPQTLKSGGQYTFWESETVELGPVQEVNQQSMFFLGQLRDLVEQSMIRPVRRGEVKSGESNNALTTSFQIADKEFDPIIESLEAGYETAARKHGRAVSALNKEFPDHADGVSVHSHLPGKEGRITMTPKDFRGWENAYQAVLDRAIPQDMNAILLQAEGKVRLGVAKEQTLEEDLKYGDAARVIERGRGERLDDVLFEQDVQAVLALSGQMFNSLTPEQVKKFTEGLANASPSVQNVVSAMGGSAGQQPNSQNGQANANRGRQGVSQSPQQTGQQVVQ
jgi:hypothetical protein